MEEHVLELESLAKKYKEKFLAETPKDWKESLKVFVDSPSLNINICSLCVFSSKTNLITY